jgi:hypothetical protein
VGLPSHTSQPHCGQAVGILLPTLHLLHRPHHRSSKWQQRRQKKKKRWSSDAVLRYTADTRTNSNTLSSPRRLLPSCSSSPQLFFFSARENLPGIINKIPRWFSFKIFYTICLLYYVFITFGVYL